MQTAFETTASPGVVEEEEDEEEDQAGSFVPLKAALEHF